MFAVLGIMLRSTVTVVETNALTKTPMIPMFLLVAYTLMLSRKY